MIVKRPRKPRKGEAVFPWGIHKGTPWPDVPADYLQQMLDLHYGTFFQQEDMRKELARRCASIN